MYSLPAVSTMRTPWEMDLTRRTLLKLGVSSAVLAALPLSRGRTAWADMANPHFLVTFVGDGGWDVTQVFDVHDPAAWQALCGRHQVVKKNFWDHSTGKLNVYAIVQAAPRKVKREIYEFLTEFFGD